MIQKGCRHTANINNCDICKNKTSDSEFALSGGVPSVTYLKAYTPKDKIKHVTYSRQEIEQTYNCETCGILQVINGVCIHTKPEESHAW